MKTFIKYAATVVVALFTLSASAQLGVPTQLITSGTSEAWASITNNTSCQFTNAIIDASKGKDVFIWCSQVLTGAGTGTNSVAIQGSGDKVTWVAMGFFNVTPNGTTRAAAGTNITVNAMPYLRISGLTNNTGNTGYITNYSVRYTVK